MAFLVAVASRYVRPFGGWDTNDVMDRRLIICDLSLEFSYISRCVFRRTYQCHCGRYLCYLLKRWLMRREIDARSKGMLLDSTVSLWKYQPLGPSQHFPPRWIFHNAGRLRRRIPFSGRCHDDLYQYQRTRAGHQLRSILSHLRIHWTLFADRRMANRPGGYLRSSCEV